MENMINASIDKNLNTICFTDHYDPLFPCYKKEEEGMFDLDTEEYLRKARYLRNNEELQRKINVRVGIELGIYPGIYDVGKKIVNSNDYDFVILSSHTANLKDPYYPEYWEGISSIEGIKQYYEEILTNVKNFNDYDVYGHLDYCIRYTDATESEKSLDNYKEILVEIFKYIIQNGKGIEINSGGLRSKLKEFNPNPEILKLYKDCKGEIITFGSDAHKCEHVAYGIDKASEILRSVGFDYIAEFKERKVSFTKI